MHFEGCDIYENKVINNIGTIFFHTIIKGQYREVLAF